MAVTVWFLDFSKTSFHSSELKGKSSGVSGGLFQRPDRSKVSNALSVLVNANVILFCHESVFFPVFKQHRGVAGGRFE